MKYVQALLIVVSLGSSLQWVEGGESLWTTLSLYTVSGHRLGDGEA